MSEEEGPIYKDGDIVWVKLGNCWWPGEVTEEGPEDFTSKKPPLAIVRFFNEATFEFVKSHNQICYYNCERKNEFIRKGMDSFRANNTHMAKFPGDVSLAEIRTDGNPNILADPVFAPQKRSAIIAEVFGSPAPKKTPKDNKNTKSRPSKGSRKPKVNITHRRFLGCDDYEAHIRVQYPGKDKESWSSDEDIAKLNAEPSEVIHCWQCSFSTKRLEVMLFHVQCHIKGITSPMVKKRASPKKKKRVKHITSDDDGTNSTVAHIGSDSEEEVKPKKKRKASSPRKPKVVKVEEEKDKATDIRTALFAEWSDSEDEEDISKLDVAASIDAERKVKEEEKAVEEPKKSEDGVLVEESKDPAKSCFDFDEEEEDNSNIVHTAIGRKIPRVIPTNKRKSTDPDNEDASLPIAEDDENRMEVLKVNETLNDNSNSVPPDPELARVEEEFKDLMESTVVPELPDVPKNSPVKSETKKEETKEVATKLTNPKKRFVKSFEDFKLLQDERRAQEEKEEELRKEKCEKTLVVESVEPPLEITEEVVVEEPLPPVQRKEEVEAEEPPLEEKKPEKSDSDVQISRLKNQIMSKLSDEEIESARVGARAHRTPRSKILESYRNDKSKVRVSVEEKEEKQEPPSIPATKKSKLIRFSEEEDEKKVEEELTKSDNIDIEPQLEEIPKSDDSDVKPQLEEPTKCANSDLEPQPEEPTKCDNSDLEPQPEEFTKSEEFTKCDNSDLEPQPEDELQPEEPTKCDNSDLESQPEEPTKSETSDLGHQSEEATKSDIIMEVEAIPEKNSDEDIGKINQIDEYLNDFLFSFPKKEEEPKPEEPQRSATPETDKPEDMSALSTLAMVSQLESAEPPGPLKPDLSEAELVSIDGNLTVVSEKDLADGQVEITACKKPVTLTNFSMDFSDCNSDSQEEKLKKPEVKTVPGPEDVFDLEEHIPSQIVDKPQPVKEEPPASKLLERLTEPKPKNLKVPTKDSTKKFVVKPNKIVKPPTPQSNKPIILSEKIIKPVKTSGDGGGSVSVQKITSKRNLHDADEIDAFIIQKGTKTEEEEVEEEPLEVPAKKLKKSPSEVKKTPGTTSASIKKRGKAKILQQTIITPAGEIIQPSVAAATAAAPQEDTNVFDINSMPIVLSDQILTPESIENMPIYLSDGVQENVSTTPKVQTIVKKAPVTAQNTMRVLNKSVASPVPKLVKTSKIVGSVGSKLIKQNSFASGSSKHGKYVIVTQSPTTTTSKYSVGKKQIIKRVGEVGLPTAGTLTKVQNIAPEPTGNKIMILTDQQGQQQRVLLTPAQQKMMGYQGPGAKITTKTVVKGNIIQKGKDGQMTAIPGSSGLISKAIPSSRTLITSSGHVLTPIQSKNVRIEKSASGRKIQMQSQKVQIKQPQQRTVLIKNNLGQTVKKLQGTDDALLEKQVAEQLEAIKASGILQQKQEILNYKSTPKAAAPPLRRSYAKKVETTPKPSLMQKPKEPVVPPLAPISPKKPEERPGEAKQERALHQLVIQDAMGNQTTITEGQILALPSETIDGQPQSYMLVTLDESGNLTPLNNEALLSLDPNLGLGGDLGNTVLQIDQSALKEEPVVTQPEPAPEPPKVEEKTPEPAPEVTQDSAVIQTMSESGQQLIVTGDPIAAQKFLESLTEGNTDLANILASAEGSSILIHADGQQILINTDSDNQMMLSVNTDSLNLAETSEGGGNPIFAAQPPKNQDILAAALADTDVFQQEQNGSQGKVSQLSPNSGLYPMNVSNVLETSLTLNSPIMTPLEVPSTNSKKIADESDILNQVPKNVDLPITITDPNISQTVSQQQVASLMANELQTNLELSLPISDASITAPSSEMNSPSFGYSLPSLDTKPFNGSMPLLTEDSEEPPKDKPESTDDPDKPDSKLTSDGSFLDESEGLCTLGSEMCSSLSEPPPDMFDLSAVLSSHQLKNSQDKLDENDLKIDDKVEEESSESGNPETASVTETSSPNTMNEDSCEIPVQPEIVTTLDGVSKDENEIEIEK